MDSNPDSPSSESSGASARLNPARTAGRDKSSIASGSGRAYTERPGSTIRPQPGRKRKSRAPWLLGAAAAIALALSGVMWKQGSLPQSTHPGSAIQAVEQQQQQNLTLTEADIDYPATAAARTALAKGETPPSLAKFDQETLNKIKSGEVKLYRQQLTDENKSQGWVIHVEISKNGVLVGDDILTPEHPVGHSYPGTPGVATHFHFTAVNAGTKGYVQPGVHSAGGSVGRTAPLRTAQSGDVDTIVK
jgi:hypothetical protein